VKIVNLPDEIKVEENVFKENFIRNLSEFEIYEYYALHVIDGMIFYVNANPLEIVKLSLQGEILGRVGKHGEGPGEFLSITGIYEFDGNIAVLDLMRRVLMIYSKSLKYIREMKLIKHHMYFFVDSIHSPVPIFSASIPVTTNRSPRHYNSEVFVAELHKAVIPTG
jgi:hypothetical protein